MLRPAIYLLPILLALGAGCATRREALDPGVAAETRAVAFLEREVPAWSRENGCFSCHNNGDGARALFAAQRAGHRVPRAALADTIDWTLKPATWDHNRGDPGFSDKRLANLQFTLALLAAREAGFARDGTALVTAARRVIADQDATGSWLGGMNAAPGSPATYGPFLGTWLAIRALRQFDLPEAHAAVAKGVAWLREARPVDMLSTATSLIAMPGDTRRQEWLRGLRQAQGADGGWGPYPDAPAEVFDTALVLLALVEQPRAAGVEDLIRRGRTYLLAQQEADGAWPATTRPSGSHSYAQRVSTTAWAMMALLGTRQDKGIVNGKR